MLNKNLDFYVFYLALKRAKTPMAMQEAINKYKDVLALPEHQELLKAIIAIVETLYKRFIQDAGASNIRFASLEEAVKMVDSTGIDWKKNTQEYFLNQFKMEERNEGILEGILKGKREDALSMLHKGFSPELIGEITKLPLEDIEELKAQKI